MRLELDARTQRPDEGLREYVRIMQELFCRADPTAPETVKAMPFWPLISLPRGTCRLRSADCVDALLGAALYAPTTCRRCSRASLCLEGNKHWDSAVALSPAASFCGGPGQRAQLSWPYRRKLSAVAGVLDFQSFPDRRSPATKPAAGTERVSGRHEPGWLMLQMWSAWTLPKRVSHATFDPARFQPGKLPRLAVVIGSPTSPRAVPTEDALRPAPAALADVLPPVPFTIRSWDRSTAVRGPRYPPSIGRVRTVTTYTVLDSADRPVAWTSCLPWEIQPHPLFGDPPLDALEPFGGLLLSDRRPIEAPQPYTAEETRILCPICRVPEISRRVHQDGSLHHSRLLAAAIRDTMPRSPPAPTTVEAAVALLRSARPDLLAQGALPAPPRCRPPTCHHSHQSMNCSTLTNEPLLIEEEGVVWVLPFALA
ncbi:hypothetical protein HPB52_005325 [Rhipicephalus sanguineus]|uniref:Uncharacterized protein n=1 Tax=Rhipicephalus sanguineus TaxID=34632 RepID=A0A9D4SQ79_RHISA|nr:hypothetical protein HPB52_005325 [Rhipicephalus sanguineus]